MNSISEKNPVDFVRFDTVVDRGGDARRYSEDHNRDGNKAE